MILHIYLIQRIYTLGQSYIVAGLLLLAAIASWIAAVLLGWLAFFFRLQSLARVPADNSCRPKVLRLR